MRPFGEARALSACLPAILLLLFAVWTGTFSGAAGAVGASAGHLALLLCLIFGGRAGWNPLALGRGGNLLLLALFAAVVASWRLSPVPRAGTTAVLLLPAFACLPAAVAGWLRTTERRRIGVLWVSFVVAGVAVWSLLDAWRIGGPVAMPLGHHNLLAAWLVILLPVAVTPWWDGGWRRLVAVLAGVTGVAAMVGTRSLAAALAVVVVALALALRRRRSLVLASAAATAVLIPQLPRILRLADFDSSLVARMGYLEAGWRGWMERPIFGWGPGATAWTVSEHLRPRPGIHPPDQIVADLHCLPLQLAYELGLTGLILLAGVAAVAWQRWRLSPTEDPRLRRAAALGLLAGAVASFGGLPLSVTALPVAVLVVLGMIPHPDPLPGGREGWAGRGDGGEGFGGRGVRFLLAIFLAFFLLPLDRAHFAYDRAQKSIDPEEQIQHLRRAVDLDPRFPLYRARLAWLQEDLEELAAGVRHAATDAYGVPSLWLAAGEAGAATDAPWTREALVRACRLNPLGALAPFWLAVATPPGPLTPEWGARAILSEPRLLAAPAWRGRPGLLANVVDWASEIEGVDAGWRQRLKAVFAGGLDTDGETMTLALSMDARGEVSLSLHAFRRQQWPAELSAVKLGREALDDLDLVSAAGQVATDPGVFAARAHCGLADLP